MRRSGDSLGGRRAGDRQLQQPCEALRDRWLTRPEHLAALTELAEATYGEQEGSAIMWTVTGGLVPWPGGLDAPVVPIIRRRRPPSSDAQSGESRVANRAAKEVDQDRRENRQPRALRDAPRWPRSPSRDRCSPESCGANYLTAGTTCASMRGAGSRVEGDGGAWTNAKQRQPLGVLTAGLRHLPGTPARYLLLLKTASAIHGPTTNRNPENVG